jgi:cell shape-determining protein MreC
MVGTVSKVRKQNLGLFQTIEVMPAISPARVEIVLVVNAAADQPQTKGSVGARNP